MSKEKIIDIMEEALFVTDKVSKRLPSKNGIISKDNIEIAKIKFIRNAISVWVDELIEKQEAMYPEPDGESSILNLETSFVILPVEEFLLLKQYIEHE